MPSVWPRLAVVAVLSLLLGAATGFASADRPAGPGPVSITIRAHRTVLFGDDLLDTPGGDASSQVAGLLAADAPGMEVVDLCLAETAATMLTRINGPVDARGDVVVFSVGSLDAARHTPLDEYALQLREILARLATARVVVVLPPNLFGTSLVGAYADATRLAAIQAHAGILDPSSTVLGGGYNVDGTTLNARGRRDLTTLIEERL